MEDASDGAPPVHVLRERVGKGDGDGEGDGVREVVLKEAFNKYEDLEKTVFALYNKRSDAYLLHFHLESHDRCDVKVKDSHWEKGAYFRSNLLSNGALRLIPHFIALLPRPAGAKKRGFDAMETAVATDRPQKKRLPKRRTSELPTIAEDAVEAAMNKDLEIVEPPASNEIVESIENEKSSDATAIMDEMLDRIRSKNNQALGQSSGPKRGPLVHQAANPLPPDVTYTTWLADCAAARQRYIDTRLNGIPPDRKSFANELMSCVVHQEMIDGKYGMIALKRCIHCVQGGKSCRVYHSDCFDWVGEDGGTRGTGGKLTFGWRCSYCRINLAYRGGCNAMHDH